MNKLQKTLAISFIATFLTALPKEISAQGINDIRHDTANIVQVDTENAKNANKAMDSRKKLEAFVQNLQSKEVVEHTMNQQFSLAKLQNSIDSLIQSMQSNHMSGLKETPKYNGGHDRLTIKEKENGQFIFKWFDLNINHGCKIITSASGDIEDVLFDQEKINWNKTSLDIKIYIINKIIGFREKIETDF